MNTLSSGNTMPRISLIIVTWNGRQYLRCLLRSIEKALSHYSNVELIFVDNSSTDGTPTIIEEYGQPSCVRFKLIQLRKNLGFSGGNNAGITYSRGDLICLLNQDTYLDERALAEIAHFFHKRPDVGVAQCALLQYRKPSLLDSCGDIISGIGLGIIGCFGEKLSSVRNKLREGREINLARGAALIVRRSILERSKLIYGAYLPTYLIAGGYEDWFISIFARSLGYKVVILPSCRILHDSLSPRKHDPYILYNALSLFTELRAPLRMFLGRILVSLLALMVTRANPIKLVLSIVTFMRNLRKRIRTRYILENLIEKNDVTLKALWKCGASATQWLRWYIFYIKLLKSIKIS